MKHSGKALRAGLKLIFWTLVLLVAVFAAGVLASVLAAAIAGMAAVLISLWLLFAAFTLFFFRDPNAVGPSIPNAIVAPAHGKVDVIDEVEEPEFMGGRCQRISIFLSVFDIHVQNAPVSGQVVYVKICSGKFVSATKAVNCEQNENVLIGFRPADYPDLKIAVRQIAGLIARRIVTWVQTGEKVDRSQRIGLIQFGSRVDLYLPQAIKVHVKLGEKVRGGETIVASFA